MRLFVVWLLLLAGCVSDAAPAPQITPGANYRESLAKETLKILQQDKDLTMAPRPVKDAYSECAAAYMYSLATPEEKTKLDAYARGAPLTIGESKEIDKSLNARAGHYTFDSLAGICPNDVPDFKKYLSALKLR